MVAATVVEPGTDLSSRLVREGQDLRFRITDTSPERHTRFLQPLYTIPGFWPYWVYFLEPSPRVCSITVTQPG